jgi:hypothetical protein
LGVAASSGRMSSRKNRLVFMNVVMAAGSACEGEKPVYS